MPGAAEEIADFVAFGVHAAGAIHNQGRHDVRRRADRGLTPWSKE
jgi:hypothetical protein